MWSQKRQLGQNNYLQKRQLSGGLPGRARQGFGPSKSLYGSLGGGYGTYGGGYASPSSTYGSPATGYAPSGHSPSGSGYGSSNSGYGYGNSGYGNSGYGRSDSYSPSGGGGRIASRSGGYGNYASYSGGYKDCPGIPLALLLITLLGIAVLGVIFFLKVQAAGRRKRSSEEGIHWEDLLPIISIGRITSGCSKCHSCAFSCTKCLRHALIIALHTFLLVATCIID